MIDLEPIKARERDATQRRLDEMSDYIKYETAQFESAKDVPALIAEVERLRAIVAAGTELADQWLARSRGYSGPPDDMPDEATYYGVQVASDFAAILTNVSGSSAPQTTNLQEES